MSNFENGGIDLKYNITKASGKPVDPEAQYFVLRLDKDPYSLSALDFYADLIGSINDELFIDLKILIVKNRTIQKKKGIKQNNGLVKKENYIKSLETFMCKVAKKVCCLPDFSCPGEGNEHIIRKIERLLHAEGIIKENVDYLNGPGKGNYIGEGSKLHVLMEDFLKGK